MHQQAAEAAWLARWTMGTMACHGLAGLGELLLDLAAAETDQRPRTTVVAGQRKLPS
jgi:hypothetical protein